MTDKQIEAEVKKCQLDPVYFAEKYLSVINAQGDHTDIMMPEYKRKIIYESLEIEKND